MQPSDLTFFVKQILNQHDALNVTNWRQFVSCEIKMGNIHVVGNVCHRNNTPETTDVTRCHVGVLLNASWRHVLLGHPAVQRSQKLWHEPLHTDCRSKCAAPENAKTLALVH